MAFLRLASGEEIALFDEHLLGRSSSADTRIDDRGASSRHALVYFSEDAWWIRDLGSTNGTQVNQQPVAAGVACRLSQGDRLQLGETTLELLDCSPPLPLALCLATRALHVGDDSLLLIQEGEETLASAYLEHGVRWWLELGGATEPLEDGQVFQCEGQAYRFFAGRDRAKTAQLDRREKRIAQLELRFGVSLDEEHVELTAVLDGESIDLKSRSHHYTLLELARQRQADRSDADLPATSRGWVDSEELIRRLGSNETKLSVEICRIRQQLSKAGFADAADIVERRRGTGQLRIGVDRFSIQSI